MAKLLINNEKVVKGKLTITRTLNQEKTGFIYNGVLATHYYIEEIKSIEAERFSIDGVEVYQESYGSDDFDILYNFTFKDFELKDILNKGYGTILSEEEIFNLEEKLYKNDHSVLGDIGIKNGDD